MDLSLYHDGRSFDERLLEREPLLRNEQPSGNLLPIAEEILLRTIYHWRYATANSLVGLTGYGIRTIETVLPSLLRKKLIKPIGRIQRSDLSVFGGEIYTRFQKPKETLDFFIHPWVRTDKKRGATKNLTTTHGLLIKEHSIYLVEAAAWVYQFFCDQKTRYIIHPETVLREVFGWHSDAHDDKEKGRKCFRTYIPDAWLISPEAGIRIEVQITYKNTDTIKHVCGASPMGDSVLYIIKHDAQSFYDHLMEIQAKECPNLMVAKLGDVGDMEKVFVHHLNRFKNKLVDPWVVREHYCRPGFVYKMVNPSRGDWLFQPPGSATS
jgi:hypothetical protein